MSRRSVAHLTALVAVVSFLAGCGAGDAAVDSVTPPLELRLVSSSVQASCSAPSLNSDGPGSACDRAGVTTYELGEPLGVVTPTTVTRSGDGAGQSVDVTFGTEDSTTLGDVTGAAVGKHLAILLDGRVLSAPLVLEPITVGAVAFSCGPAEEAARLATDLGAVGQGESPTP